MQTDQPCHRTLAAWVHRSSALQIASVAFGYIVFARFASTYAMASSGAIVLWLPNAVVLSALLLTPSSQWWKFGLTQLLSELLVAPASMALRPTLGFALSNVLEVLLSACLIRRLCGPHFAFSNVREVVLFAAIAMGLAPGLAALLGTWISLEGVSEPMSFLKHWQILWIGDGMGMVVLTPLLFGWLHLSRQSRPASSTSWRERLLFMGLLLGLLQLLFMSMPDPNRPWLGGSLFLLPLFFWAALRFGTLGVSLLGCVVSLLAIVLTFQGRGVFSLLDPGLKTQVLQQYLAALMLTGLAVAAIVNDLGLKYHSLGQYKQELVAAHASLLEMNQELEKRVFQRTAELERLATTDALTGAHNRRFLMSRAEIEIAVAKRQSYAVSMVVFDIDHFKQVNDSHGHNVGDQVLVALSQAVRQELRLGDTFARVGGEEFVLLLPRSDAAQAKLVADRLRAMLEALDVEVVDAGKPLVLHITASFGVASLDAHTSAVDGLYVAADRALYQAKNAGRNRVVQAGA